MKFKRGYIYDYEVNPGDIRTALVVSADFRAGDDILNVIVLSTERKTMHDVLVGGCYYADPCAVSFAWSTRLGGCIVGATACEMETLDNQIMYCLGLEDKVSQEVTPPHSEPRNFAVELAEAKTEARVYRELFERLQTLLSGRGSL